MKNKTIYWLTRDDFNEVFYDEEVKMLQAINNITFLISFKRWEKSLATNKWGKVKTTAIATQIRKDNNIVYIKIGAFNG